MVTYVFPYLTIVCVLDGALAERFLAIVDDGARNREIWILEQSTVWAPAVACGAGQVQHKTAAALLPQAAVHFLAAFEAVLGVAKPLASLLPALAAAILAAGLGPGAHAFAVASLAAPSWAGSLPWGAFVSVTGAQKLEDQSRIVNGLYHVHAVFSAWMDDLWVAALAENVAESALDKLQGLGGLTSTSGGAFF
jgi:hypothetical protein